MEEIKLKIVNLGLLYDEPTTTKVMKELIEERIILLERQLKELEMNEK